MEIGDKSMKAWLGWLCVALVISLAGAGCKSSNSTSVTIAISPSSATILLGTSLQFIPSVIGSSNAVTWSVNGVANGNATFGTISSTGLYTAPAIRPVSASGAAVPIVFAMANASIPNSGSTGSVIELQSGSNFTTFAAGNTINISGNSVAGWNGSFIIVFAAPLQNGNFGVQIATPAGPPANGVGGIATATPNITITAQVQSTSAIASATVTLDSGVRVSFAQPTCTIGTTETFNFLPLVAVTGTSNTTVKWSVTGVGSIETIGDPNPGLYTAPATAGTATVTATSTADPTESASATVTIVTAVDPTLASISPPTGALGAAFLEVYLTGSNFICTTGVFVNNGVKNVPLSANFLSTLSSTTLLVTVPDSILATVPASGSTVPLTFTVQRENGSPQSCSACVLTLSPVRPALVAAKPDSKPLPSGAFDVTLDGGYFGSSNLTAGVQGKPVVNVQVNGQSVPVLNSSNLSTSHFSLTDQQLTLSLLPTPYFGSSTPMPGLFPITVVNTVSCPTLGLPMCETASVNGSMAAANLAVQPTSAPTQIGLAITVGTTPSSVSINTATGMAVVANQGSNDITLVSLGSLGTPSLSILTASLCTGSLGSVFGPGCAVASGPVSVAVDNLRNLALLANSANATLAVVNLGNPTAVPPVAPTVTALLSFPSADINGNPLPLAPQAVGINPVTGRALVAFTTSNGIGGSNAGAILDMNQLQTTHGSVTLPPAVLNVVNLNSGPNPHVAVSPRLNWALATPGGVGSLSIVDLNRQTISQMSTLSCSAGVVTATTTATLSLLAGQPVLISGATPSTLNGIFQVRSVSNTTFTFAEAPCASGTGGTATYALPVATLATNPNVRGVSINDETQKALLVDPTSGVPGFVFNILDQTSALVNALTPFKNVATAMNPLTNIGVIVNESTNRGFIVDPTVPTVVPMLAFTTGNFPVDVAIDPAANTALIVNQHDNPPTVSLFSLGALRPGPQIIQSSFLAAGSAQASSRVIITSGLNIPATAPNQTVTLIGRFTNTTVCGMNGDCPRLDGDPSPFTGVSISANGRVMTATLPGSFLAGHGPRLYVLDVTDSSTSPETFSNVAPLQAIQAVSLVTGDCSNPAPQGVAIDTVHDVAVVTEPGCNPTGAGDVSLVSLSTSTGFPVGTGFGAKPELAVGTNPQGIAVYPQAGLAVAANAGSNTVSIVDIVHEAVPVTFTTDPIPDGVAVDLGTGKAVVTANGASVVDVFPVSTTAQTPTTIGVQQGPSGVAIDPKGHIAVVSNSSSNTASIVNLTSNTTTNRSNPISFPQGVAFDPISGSFLITSGASNQVIVLNPATVSALAIRVGIDPSSIAHNFESGTLVTANNLSGTMTVVDFIDQTVRGVFSLPSSTQFAVAIHPQTNLAVVADPVDNQLLLVPLPH
jgi:DNA-binding beta-propeller fold protein YncE